MIISSTFHSRILAITCSNIKKIHTSATCSDRYWRAKVGLPRNKTLEGPLTDLPDYTFLDGRPTPLGSHQYDRLKKQEERAIKMVNLISEMDFAVDRHKKMTEEAEKHKEKVISGRLKEKGNKLKSTKK